MHTTPRLIKTFSKTVFAVLTAAALSATVGVTLTACQPAPPPPAAKPVIDLNQPFQQLGLGATQYEAVNTMGKPARETTKTTLGVASTVFTWNDSNARYEATFVLDRLTSKTRVAQ